MAPLKLYVNPISPFSRSVLFTARAIDLEYEEIFVDSVRGGTLTPEFKALNPQHTVPTMVDGDYVLWESRVICTYLATKFGKSVPTLYPVNDLIQKSEIDKFLNFDYGFLLKYFELVLPVAFRGQKSFDEKRVTALQDAFKLFEFMIQGRKYAAGDNLTVADHALISTVTSCAGTGVIDVSKYPNVASWVERCEENMKGFNEDKKGLKIFSDMFKEKLSGVL